MWWTVPVVVVVVVVVEVGAVFTGFGAVVPRMSISTTDFAREVSTHGIDGSVDRLLAPFLHFLDEEVQLCSNHIRLHDGMHALRAGLESFIAPPLVGVTIQVLWSRNTQLKYSFFCVYEYFKI